MKGFADLLKTTIAGGFFVLLPIVLVFLIIQETITITGDLLSPIAAQFPVEEVGGIAVARLLAILLILAFCFITGLIMRMRIGIAAKDWLERTLLERLPGYSIIKAMTHRFSGGLEGQQFAPAEVDLYGSDTRVPALIMDQSDEANFTVFVPLAPTPTVGQIYVVPRQRVQQINVSMGAFINTIMAWGIRSKNK